MELQSRADDCIRLSDRARYSLHRADILVRLYEIEFRLNEVRTRQFVMTDADRDDAVRRLKIQYPDAAVDVLRASLRALSWRRKYEGGGSSEPHAHDNVQGRSVHRGEYEWWTSDLLAAARRVVKGKPLESQPRKEACPATVAGWKFKDVRRILRQDRGEGFVLQEVVQVFPSDRCIELPEVIRRLAILGYLDERAPGWWRTTRKGALLRKRSVGRFSRERAMGLIRDLKDRISSVNADAKYLYKVKTAVVFGSALEERGHIGDVDIAIEFVPRHSDPREHSDACDAVRERAPDHVRRTIFGDSTWPSTEVEVAVVGEGRGRISLGGLDELERVFRAERKRPPKHAVIFGAWEPPKRPRRRRVTLGRSAKNLVKQMVGGRVLVRRRDRGRVRYSRGSSHVDERVVEGLIEAGAFKDETPSSDAELVTDRWVLSAAAYAALERGFFLVDRARKKKG